MYSDFQQQNYQHHQQQTNNLTRIRSAPSSYYASFLDSVNSTIPSNEPIHIGQQQQQQQPIDFSNERPLSPETETIFARFMSTMADADHDVNDNTSSNKFCRLSQDSTMDQSQYVVKQETESLHQHEYHKHMIYRSQSKPPLARQNTVMDQNSFHGCGSNNLDNSNGGLSGLTRHSSSPAGFFSNIMNMDDGLGVIKGMGNLSTTASELMNQSSEIGAKRFKSEGNNNTENNYMTDYYPPMTSWDDSVLSEKFPTLERADGRKTFSQLNSSEKQGEEGRNRPQLLSHHLSLPKTYAELSDMEKLVQFQDTVPCRIRAKRGCATHPRSIAERVRRTKISERMRKLQDLVPHMDKQTNTADMLDLAVDYIKDLQNQLKSLTDNRAKCTCC